MAAADFRGVANPCSCSRRIELICSPAFDLRLSFLSPEIIRMILDGRHPPALTARTLLSDTLLPIAWRDQLAALS